VRGGHFQEALDLAAHAARLAMCSPHVQVLQDVHAEANSTIRMLFGQLFATLRPPGRFPTLFHAVSFLWRMRVLPESELALIFLTGRLVVLNAALTSAVGEKRGLDAPDVWARILVYGPGNPRNQRFCTLTVPAKTLTRDRVPA
jgi:conserved oligomeric Golgi complex subunit 8